MLFRSTAFSLTLVLAGALPQMASAAALITPAQWTITSPFCRGCHHLPDREEREFRIPAKFNASENHEVRGVGSDYVLDPVSADDFLQRGNYHLNRSEYDAALEEYSKAIENDRLYGNAYYNRGLAHFNRLDYERAVKDLDRAAELLPHDYEVFLRRGEVYYYWQMPDDAIEDLDTAIQLNPRDAEAYVLKGLLLVDRDESEQAVAHF